ncbi:protein GrpE [Enterocloster clostridioformis]|nr:nucleotide exchange factor GrpE [Enterocloster clostridioformis]GEA36451.1 protein GrpE [Enterocloster clostridioformis]
MSEDMKDEELKKEDEALKAEQAGGKDQASETGEAKETEASNDIPETQEGTPDETEETEETEESTEQVPAGEKEEKKGFFKKKKDPRDEKIEELTDRVKRQMAEFENFRKRTDKEKSAMYEMGAKDIIERILPVIDNFERGLATVPEDAKETPLAEGMEKIYKQFRKTLEEAGVKAIEAVGQEFDPNYHNAVMHVDDDSLGENIVAEELQKGYMYRDSVVRHSMVKVAN